MMRLKQRRVGLQTSEGWRVGGRLGPLFCRPIDSGGLETEGGKVEGRGWTGTAAHACLVQVSGAKVSLQVHCRRGSGVSTSFTGCHLFVGGPAFRGCRARVSPRKKGDAYRISRPLVPVLALLAASQAQQASAPRMASVVSVQACKFVTCTTTGTRRALRPAAEHALSALADLLADSRAGSAHADRSHAQARGGASRGG